MRNKIIKDYFSFTKKERIGVIILVFVIITVFLVPYLLPEKAIPVNSADWEQFRTQSEKPRKAGTDSTNPADGSEDYSALPHELPTNPRNNLRAFERQDHIETELFYFDPNTLSEKGWLKLGLRGKTISTIQNYLSKGGKFRYSQDLGKIYGLHKDELEKLIPYVKINNSFETMSNKAAERSFLSSSFHLHNTKYASASTLDINTADTAQLIALPGIGSKLALRIVHFREKLGAFHSVDQLADVYGLPDSTFRKLQPRLTASEKAVRLININSASIDEIKELPYLKWNVANAIIEYRNRHGPFTSVNELLQIEIVTRAMLEKMAPYLTIY